MIAVLFRVSCRRDACRTCGLGRIVLVVSQDRRSAFMFSVGCKAYGDSSRTTVVTGNVVDARITGV